MGRERTTRQSLRRIVTMSDLLLIAMVASGCTVFNGGGYLNSLSDPLGTTAEKATFGINGKCRDGKFRMAGQRVQGAGLFDGSFQYDDHAFTMNGAGVRFHGKVTATDTNPPLLFLGLTCQQAKQLLDGGPDSPGLATFLGTYRPQDRALATACSRNPARSKCTFRGEISDLGEPGIQTEDQSGDFFSIQVQSGPFFGYHNAGNLQGGNIQVD